MEQVISSDGRERPDASEASAPRGFRALAAAVRLALAAGVALGVVALLTRWGPEHAQTASVAEAAFVEDGALPPLVAMSLPASLAGQVHYVARARLDGAERRDTLTIGDWANGDFFMDVEAARGGTAPPSLFVSLASGAAGIGAAVLRAANPQGLASERGPLEWAEATLAGAAGGRRCLAFRLAPGDGGARVSGFACGSRDQTIDESRLACLIGALSATREGAALGFDLAPPRRAAACLRDLA